jgi:hypothetical protein
MRSDQIKEGLAFVNFLGHSGGRTWGVDIGSPNDMENTTGQLPFVSSVSCNVGAYAEPSNNVLSEEFVLADNRGAIAVWSSSSLGYAYTGSILVDNFLRGLSRDSLREFGKLTSAARYRLWMEFGGSYITAAAMNCTPLQGDPRLRAHRRFCVRDRPPEGAAYAEDQRAQDPAAGERDQPQAEAGSPAAPGRRSCMISAVIL